MNAHLLEMNVIKTNVKIVAIQLKQRTTRCVDNSVISHLTNCLAVNIQNLQWEYLWHCALQCYLHLWMTCMVKQIPIKSFKHTMDPFEVFKISRYSVMLAIIHFVECHLQKNLSQIYGSRYVYLDTSICIYFGKL